MNKQAFDILGKPAGDVLKATAPWALGGAGLGALTGAATYGLEDEEARKHDSLTNSMLMGAAMGGVTGLGAKAVGAMINPLSIDKQDVFHNAAKDAPNTGVSAQGAAIIGRHPWAVGGGSALAHGGIRGLLGRLAGNKGAAGDVASVESFAKKRAAIDKLNKTLGAAAVGANGPILPSQVDVDLHSKLLQDYENTAKNFKPTALPTSRLGALGNFLKGIKGPAITGTVAGMGAATLGRLQQQQRAYDIMRQGMPSPAE